VIKTEEEQERDMAEWSDEERNTLIPNYGCDLLVEGANDDQIHDKSYPNDTYQVHYNVNGNLQVDLCRGKRSDIFDLYYDKFGKGVVVKIDWAYGRVNPKLWGYKVKEKKKRK